MSGAILAVFAAGSLISGLLYGARHWVRPLWVRFGIGMVLLGVGVTFFFVVNSLWALAAVMFVTGFAIAPTLINGNGLVQELVAPGRLTEGLTWVGTALGIGVSIGSSIAGARIEAAGSHGGFLVVVIAGGVAVVATLASLRTLRAGHEARLAAALADADVVEESSDTAAQAVEGDLDELQKKAAERDEYLALAQRTQADFENYRKRMVRDGAGARERGAGNLAKELLPALDNLARAVDAAGDDGSEFANGVRLVQSELTSALKKAGIEAFDPKGEAFDPEQHEAIAHAPIEGVASNTIAEVYQQGYRLNDTILRPARVVVAQ